MRIFLASIVACTLLAGCSEHRHEGPLERAGKRWDEVVDNAQEGDPLLKRKGPLEKAGESVDDALSGRSRDR